MFASLSAPTRRGVLVAAAAVGHDTLATKRSDSGSPSESARRQSCEGGSMARQVDSPKTVLRRSRIRRRHKSRKNLPQH